MTCRPSAILTTSENAAVYISVSPEYLAAKQTPDSYWFSYYITIENRGECDVQLLSRHWQIIDGDLHTREVSGDGVVGQQPLIAVGKKYQYTSYVDFPTPIGYMKGSYTIKTDNGRQFEATIDMFSLRAPGIVH